MSVPFGAKFDRFAQMTDGLVAIGNGPVVNANYLALTTWFMYGENWIYCNSQPTTSWTMCAASVSTTWSLLAAPTTGWTLVPTG